MNFETRALSIFLSMSVGVLSLSSCSSSSQKVEEACSLVIEVKTVLPIYPAINEFDFNTKKTRFDNFWNGGGARFAPKMREAADLFRSISADNSEMARFATISNQVADSLEFGVKRSQEEYDLYNFCE